MQLGPLQFPPPLDPGFQPAALFHRRYRGDEPLVIGLEREHGLLARFETKVRATPDDETLRHVERLVKFLLWARGGWRLHLGGPRAVIERIRVRPFDADLMSRVYERPVEIALTTADAVPPAREAATALGGHLDGCRIGFDLGASDYKVAAVQDGAVVCSAEFPWNPKDEPDPATHYRLINEGLKKAAATLPRVDAIGGSSAGVIVGNRLMAASLIRAVPADKLDAARNLFLRLRAEWGVPLEVLNEGDVTALAGGMSLQVTGVLGIAMGSSEAAGYLDRQGRLTGWLSELAFAPVDVNPTAPADEWSGDCGVGALYFSQQAVNKLLPAAGIAAPPDMGLPDRLKLVQQLMAAGDPRAARIYETIGRYLGYALPHYAAFYDFQHVLLLGRVTTGEGGNIVLRGARETLAAEFPDLARAIELHVPDEKGRRVGQAVAAASLPAWHRATS